MRHTRAQRKRIHTNEASVRGAHTRNNLARGDTMDKIRLVYINKQNVTRV